MSAAESRPTEIAIPLTQGRIRVPSRSPVPLNWGTKRRFWIIPVAVAAVALIPLGLGWKLLMSDSAVASDALVLHTVTRGSLAITVTERGNLESQNTVEIMCEVDNVGGDRYGTSGTQILFIVPNGSSVKKGDLLVELDSAPLKERLDSQFLALKRAEADMIQAESKYQNQITQNETNLAEAQLQVELAKLDRDSYYNEQEGGSGTYQIAMQNIEMQIHTARAQQMIFKADRDAVEELHKLGYRSKGDLERARLQWLEASSNLASQIAGAHQMSKYTRKMEVLTRDGKYVTAVRNQEQVKRNNEAELAQALAARDSAQEAHKKEQERYDRYKGQLEKCRITAPQDGMIAYAMDEESRRSGTVIAEGASVRQRQKILTIPDLSRMQVKTAIHESALDQVDTTKSAVIRVDAFSDRSYVGKVVSVAVLPDQGNWFSSDTKVYRTIVTIDEEVDQLKPGMTAVAEIHIETLKDVLSLPVQAIVQRGESSWCYVHAQGGIAQRPVTLGKTNDKFVEIKEGLAEGDIVVLNPMSLMGEEEKTAEKEEKAEEAGEGTEKKPGTAPKSAPGLPRSANGNGSAESEGISSGTTAESDAPRQEATRSGLSGQDEAPGSKAPAGNRRDGSRGRGNDRGTPASESGEQGRPAASP